MASGFDFKRLRRTTVIHLVVQVFLLVLLCGSAFVLLGKIPSQFFINTIIRVIAVQAILFYPIYKFASSDALREIDAAQVNLSDDELNALRRKRVFSDILKGALIIFFVAFIMLLRTPSSAPQIPFSILFIFLLSYLTYLQCFNYVAKRLMREKS